MHWKKMLHGNRLIVLVFVLLLDAAELFLLAGCIVFGVCLGVVSMVLRFMGGLQCARLKMLETTPRKC